MFDVLIKGGSVVDGTGKPAFTADIGVRAGRIVEIGKVQGAARQTVSADGALVTPGWIDAHTHYDGQVTWDDALEGSAANGVTTVIMGNCGVGFAPVARGNEKSLIELMEGVEDIPGTALYEGMPWGEWETFPEYLDLLGRKSWSVDVGAQVAHGALRHYVMGERAITDVNASVEDIAAMANLLETAARAGALGFSTSRVRGHMDTSGRPVPGTFAAEEELFALARALQSAGGRVFQAIAAGAGGDSRKMPEQTGLLDDLSMLARISRTTGQPLVFSSIQLDQFPEQWRDVLALVDKENGTGARMAPMVASRPVTFLMSLRCYHPFLLRPTYLAMRHLPHDQLMVELRQPAIKAAILAEEDNPEATDSLMERALPKWFRKVLGQTFPMYEGFDYEPEGQDSLAGRAVAAGRDVLDFTYDFLLEDEGRSVAVFLSSNYTHGNLDCCRTMLSDPHTVLGLSDAGAHVRFICDMSSPTYNIKHWARDRTRGERLPVELLVAKATGVPARLFGLNDRGTLAVGARADVNLIDFAGLTEHMPELLFDLPAGGSRFVQRSSGYVATFVNGIQTRTNDQDTGARPGRLAKPVSR